MMYLTLTPLISAINHTSSPNQSVQTNQNQGESKIDKGFACLEDKAEDCSDLSTQELALTILATPENIFDKCVTELKNRQASNHWTNVKDTGLAILALNHAGEDTSKAEEWLITQERNPTELIWYLEQDSNQKTECRINYDSKEFIINIGENKKIDKDAGPCLTRSQSNFWLKVAPECYSKDFTLGCDQDFIATMLYKDKNSPTLYVLEGTQSAPASNTIKISVNSKCFGESSCEYEATLWAALALLKTGNTIENYLPYIVALSDSNKRYLPKSFIYMLTNLKEYATQLSEDQTLGNYWQADNSAYNRFYDTSLALVALGKSSSEQITKSKDWLLFNQGANGCWQNSIRDTAISLWALTSKAGKAPTGGSTTYCSQANYFCIPSTECPSGEDVGNNYFCASLSDTCCEKENLKSCSDYDGSVCDSTEICSGDERKATDTNACCTGTCKPKPTETECASKFFSCKSSCSDNQEEISYTCNQGQVCCKAKSVEQESGGFGFLWIITISIIIVMAIIGWIIRDKLKLYWFQLTSKFKKDKGTRAPPVSRGPPRPGFPPVRRAPAPMVGRRHPPLRQDKELSNTFKKLKDMSR